MLKNTVTTLTRLSAACAAVAAISVAQPVFAQTQAPAASPAPAEAAANRSPELSLQATASSEVKQDTVRIALAAEVEGGPAGYGQEAQCAAGRRGQAGARHQGRRSAHG